MDKNKFIMSYSIDKTFDSDQFLKLRLRVCHDQESPNKTYFTKETMEEANKKSLEYIPILAHVYMDENGKPIIGAHDMHVEEDRLNEGGSRLIYDEQPIGVVPSVRDNNWTIEEFNGLNYTFVDAYIWRDYSNYAEQLVEDAESVKLSMEIDFQDDSLSYDAANERYNIAAYRYRGITLLNESLGTGMKDARATTTNFSANEDIKSKMIVLMEELQQCLRDYNNDSDEKGGNVDMANEEIMEVVMEEEVETEEVIEEVETPVEVEEEFVEEEVVVEENSEEVVEEPVTEEFELEPLVCTFRISHDDIRYGLQNLLNAMCDESHFFYVESVFDKYFYYTDYCSGNSYIQKYKTRKDEIKFDGEPEAVFREFVTQSERDELENMRKNYAMLVEFKEQVENAELRSQKEAILMREEYNVLAEDEAFAELKAAIDNYSVEELEVKADVMFAKFVKAKGEFSANADNKKIQTVGFNFTVEPTKKQQAYNGLFEDEEE